MMIRKRAIGDLLANHISGVELEINQRSHAPIIAISYEMRTLVVLDDIHETRTAGAGQGLGRPYLNMSEKSSHF